MKRLFPVFVMILCLMTLAFAEEPIFAAQGIYRVFCADGLMGVQTLHGDTVVPAQYTGIQPFQGDLCVVEGEYQGGHCYGLWRLSTGEELLPCCYASMQIAGSVVLLSDPYGPDPDAYWMRQLYDPENDRIILDVRNTAYDGIEYYVPTPLANGLCFVLTCDDSFDNQCLIACDGTALIDNPDYTGFSDTLYSRGILEVSLSEGTAFRFFNVNTESWLDGQYEWTFGFIDGYAAVQGDDWEWFVIDENGNTVSPAYNSIAFAGSAPEYGQYGSGLFAVKQNDGWSVIRVQSDAEPETLFGPIQCIRDPLYLRDQTFAFRTDQGTLVFSANDGRQLMLEGVTVDDPNAEHCIVIRSGEQKGFLFDDMSVIHPAFDDCIPFLTDRGFVKIDDCWHPINREGQVDMPISYSSVQYSHEGGYYLVEDDAQGYLCLNQNLDPISRVNLIPDVFLE